MPSNRRLAQQKEAAEGRYERYGKELKDMIYRAESQAQRGEWSEVANTMQAAVAQASAMVGVARELNLIYLMWED